MPDNFPIRLFYSQLPQAAEVLAAAFQQDPMYIQVQPDEVKRRTMLARLFVKVVRYALHYGQVYTTPALEGVACWLPPGHTHLTVAGLLRSGLVSAPLAMGLPAYLRFDRYMTYADKLHETHAPQIHWYLWAIGVDPARQGRGVGSRLLQPVLAQADADQTACYLDTGTERNTRFYQKQGFKVMEQGSTPRDGVQVWAMLRPPNLT
jgi:ribosomal protein S18 acetylase RimI-like enzyme